MVGDGEWVFEEVRKGSSAMSHSDTPSPAVSIISYMAFTGSLTPFTERGVLLKALAASLHAIRKTLLTYSNSGTISSSNMIPILCIRFRKHERLTNTRRPRSR